MQSGTARAGIDLGAQPRNAQGRQHHPFAPTQGDERIRHLVSAENDGDLSGRRRRGLERAMGIEATLAAWEAAVLPLNYTRAGESLCPPVDAWQRMPSVLLNVRSPCRAWRTRWRRCRLPGRA